jgi:hypothetical protein
MEECAQKEFDRASIVRDVRLPDSLGVERLKRDRWFLTKALFRATLAEVFHQHDVGFIRLRLIVSVEN